MKDYMRYAILVISILVVIVLLVLGFNFIRNIFTKDSSKDKPKQTQSQESKKVKLNDVAKDGTPVKYTISGPINGDEQHRSVRFTVDNNVRRVEILQGYNDQIVKSQETTNNDDAYKAFVSALDGAGFSKSIKPEGRGSEDQSCPLGQHYKYEISTGTSNDFSAWANNCSRKQGTFTGNRDLVRKLFQLQIPNYNEFMRGTKLT